MESAAATISHAQEAAIKRIFDALVAADLSSADNCLASTELMGLSSALNDPLSPVDLDRATKILGERISFEAFIEYWRNDDYE